MDGLNFPNSPVDWFQVTVATLAVTVVSALLVRVMESKITAAKAALYTSVTLGASVLLVVTWYNAPGFGYFVYANSQEESSGCIVAFPSYKRSVQANPHIVEARNGLVRCAIKMSRIEDALRILEPLQSVLELSPTYWREMAYLYEANQSYDKLIVAATASADLAPFETTWVVDLGEQLHRRFEYPTAEAMFRIARYRTPNDAESLFWLAWALYEQGKYDDALQHFDECITSHGTEIDYSLIRCHAGKGFTLFDMQRYEEARIELAAALGLDPNQQDVAEQLVRIR